MTENLGKVESLKDKIKELYIILLIKVYLFKYLAYFLSAFFKTYIYTCFYFFSFYNAEIYCIFPLYPVSFVNDNPGLFLL